MNNLFLFGLDAIQDVKDVRDVALSHINGVIREWSANNLTCKRIEGIAPEKVLHDANIFLRLYDPAIRAINPIVIKTKPFIR